MRSKLTCFLFISILFLGLLGCDTNNLNENVSGEAKAIDFKKVDDFEVSINVGHRENNLNVYATITYVGKEASKDIYHGGSIFFFNVHQQDGSFEYLGGMDQPLLITKLSQGEPHIVDFNLLDMPKLNPGVYEFEAIAHFSLDDDVIGTVVEIPVSKIAEIE